MRIIKQLLCGVVVLLAVSCAKEKAAAPAAGEGITQITASWGDEGYSTVNGGADSKTVLAKDGTSVLWSPNDEISVFFDGDGVKFTSINSTAKAWTIFSSSTALVYGGTELSEKPYLYAVYPYSSDNAQSGDVLTLTVPASQTAVEGSFARGSYPSVARSMNTDFAFYNVCGGVRFTLCQSGIRKIVLTGKNNETLAGKVKVQFDDNNHPIVSAVVEGEKSITLIAPNNGEFETGKWYYMSVLPVAFSSEGLSFEFIKRTDESERGIKTIASAKEIKRSLFGSVENVDSDVKFGVDILSFSVSPTEVIVAPMAAAQLSLIILPTDAQYEWIKWTTSDKTIATVDEDGLIVGKKNGKCTVTVTSDSGKSDSCAVYVCKTPVTTNAASELAYSRATLNGIYNITGAESVSKKVFFLYSNIETTLEGLKANGTKLSSSLSGTDFQATISGLATGTQYNYVAALTIFGQTVYGDVKSFITKSLPAGAVDMGLSVLWHQFNIGASSPEEYGRYFAWGDVTGQTWNGSSWSGGGFSTYPNYELDDNNNLKPAYDAAHVILGGKWRMPTIAEQQELINNCFAEWITYNGVYGRRFTSAKTGYTDKSIFLPAAGSGYYSRLYDAGSCGDYWSGTFYSGNYAWRFYFGSADVNTNHTGRRSDGQSVRPVSE